MIVGVPKEIKPQEGRVGMTPAGVLDLVRSGHEVHVQKTAGESSGIPDAMYEEIGAKMVASAEDVWGNADMIVKVKEPIAPEWPLVRPMGRRSLPTSTLRRVGSLPTRCSRAGHTALRTRPSTCRGARPAAADADE